MLPSWLLVCIALDAAENLTPLPLAENMTPLPLAENMTPLPLFLSLLVRDIGRVTQSANISHDESHIGNSMYAVWGESSNGQYSTGRNSMQLQLRQTANMPIFATAKIYDESMRQKQYELLQGQLQRSIFYGWE